MRRALRSEQGQVLPLAAFFLVTVLLGVAALAIDFGVWYTKSRQVQSVADAAALAAGQDLPGSPSAAVGAAESYAADNDGTLAGAPVISATDLPNDTVTVAATGQAPAVFARIFGISSITVHAHASAQAAGVGWVPGHGIEQDGTGKPIPFAVGSDTVEATPLDQPTTLSYGPSAAVAGGQFGLVDFADAKGGTPPKTVADWLENGFSGTLGPGDYGGITGNKFMPQAVRDAMDDVVAAGKPLLLPVFSGTNGASGGPMTYTVVGWAAFVPTGYDASGSTTTLSGSFVHLETTTQGGPGEYFGVGQVKLTK